MSAYIAGIHDDQSREDCVEIGKAMDKPRVAFVIQRYGLEVNGGAETLCRLLAEQMCDDWDVEILSSCAREYVNRFENDYPAGKEIINKVKVQRFIIDYFRSEDESFSRLDEKVLSRESSREEDMLWLKEVGPYSSELLSYIQDSHQHYDFFFFFTYLYATTTLILPSVREKAFLVTAAHDEPPIYAQFFDHFFDLPVALFFNTQEELAFLQKRTSGSMPPSFVVGVGIDPPLDVCPELFRREFQIDGDFILYVGRIQREKGCGELFENYLALPDGLKDKYPLILVGKSAMSIPVTRHIIPVGFISEELKYSAMSAARLVLMPSRFESLNMVLLESWLCNTPVLVNGNCDVLRAQCRKSNGGLWYENFEEFEACLDFMLSNENLSKAMAASGKRYVEENYNWDQIKSKYLKYVQDALKSQFL